MANDIANDLKELTQNIPKGHKEIDGIKHRIWQLNDLVTSFRFNHLINDEEHRVLLYLNRINIEYAGLIDRVMAIREEFSNEE